MENDDNEYVIGKMGKIKSREKVVPFWQIASSNICFTFHPQQKNLSHFVDRISHCANHLPIKPEGLKYFNEVPYMCASSFSTALSRSYFTLKIDTLYFPHKKEKSHWMRKLKFNLLFFSRHSQVVKKKIGKFICVHTEKKLSGKWNKKTAIQRVYLITQRLKNSLYLCHFMPSKANDMFISFEESAGDSAVWLKNVPWNGWKIIKFNERTFWWLSNLEHLIVF